MAEDDVSRQISRLLDNQLLDWLQNGRPEIGEKGKIVRVPLKAADIKVITDRLKQLGAVTSDPNQDSTVQDLIKTWHERGVKFNGSMPDIDTEEPDAATG
jgi:hypothetical protein